MDNYRSCCKIYDFSLSLPFFKNGQKSPDLIKLYHYLGSKFCLKISNLHTMCFDNIHHPHPVFIPSIRFLPSSPILPLKFVSSCALFFLTTQNINFIFLV